MFAFWILFFPFKFQSILSQGEWPYKSNNARPSRRFQSTLPQGEWRRQRSLCTCHAYFNPHSRKGSDGLWCCCMGSLCTHFNPHSRKGSDFITCIRSDSDVPFQSTLPQGEWPVSGYGCVCIKEFQSTLPQGEWPSRVRVGRTNGGFQSTLPQGEWPELYLKALENWLFQSTLPQGEWLHWSIRWKPPQDFNPHSRKGSDRKIAWFLSENKIFLSILSNLFLMLFLFLSHFKTL